MTRTALLAALLLAPGLAFAQSEPRSGPNAPATSSQVPPTSLPNEARDRVGPNQPGSAPGDANSRTGASETRTAPPQDHRVLGGPPVPGATQPQHSEGITTNRDVIPPHVGDRPPASTTGRDTR
jgi:hypothetical protein